MTLRDFPEDYFSAKWLSKPPICVPNGVQRRPPRDCVECGKPLPEVRTWNQVACPGACQAKRKERFQMQANDKQNRERKAERCRKMKASQEPARRVLTSAGTAPPRL